MKIKVLRNLGSGLPAYKEGQVVEADSEICEKLCKLGLAVLVEQSAGRTKQSSHKDQ